MQVSESSLRELWHITVSHAPQPGERYRHYKGHVYVIVGPCINEESMTPSVVYRDPDSGVCWMRTLANFTEMVANAQGGEVPRFSKVTV